MADRFHMLGLGILGIFGVIILVAYLVAGGHGAQPSPALVAMGGTVVGAVAGVLRQPGAS